MWFDYPTYALLFLIPAYLVRFEVLGIPTNLWEIMFAAVFLLWLFSAFEWRRAFRGFSILHPAFTALRLWRQAPFSILFFGVFLLFSGLLLGTIMSPQPRVSLGALKGWFIEPVLFALMMRSVLKQPEQQKKALVALATSGVCVALAAIFYWFLGGITFDGRVRAFYESPNMLATQVAPAILIVALGRLNAKGKAHLRVKGVCCEGRVAKLQLKIQNWRAVLPIGAGVLLIVVLFLTRSVGAIISLFVTFFLWWVCGKLRGKPWGKRAGILVGGVLLLVPLVSFFVDPWTFRPSSLASRLMIWKSALLIAQSHGLSGRGLGTFQYDYLAYQAHFPPYLEWAVPHPHNIFLGTLLAGGILGLCGIVCILFSAVQRFRELLSKQSAASFAVFFVLLYLLLHGIIDNTLWRGDTALFWGSIFGLILACSPKLPVIHNKKLYVPPTDAQ